MSLLTSSTGAWPAQADAAAFYGRIEIGHDGLPTERWQARALTTVQVPYPFRLAWEPETVVRKITCHRLVAASLTRCLAQLLEHYGSIEALRAAGLDLYGGCYAFRPMRGGAALSMHAYGVAIDLDPDHNPLGRKWQEGGRMMPKAAVEIFETAGWTWGGRWSHRPDCMHFQAARI